MKTRNLTLALPEDLVTRLKVVAAQQDTSISAMVTHELEKLADKEQGYRQAMRELLEDARKGYGWGIGHKVPWTRESLYERKPLS